MVFGGPKCRYLLRFVHVNVFVQHIGDGAVAATKFGVNPLVRVMHVAVAKGDIAHDGAADRSDCQPDPTGVDPLEQHVGGAVLHGNAVILIPHVAVVNPDIVPRHIEAIRVEGRNIDHVVAIVAIPPGADIAPANFQPIHAIGPEGPVRGVQEQQVFDHDT